MKKRTAFIGAILSLIPLGQPLLIKTGVVLSTTSLMLSFPEKINAETFEYFFDLAYDKGNKGDYYGAISDLTKAIEINPNYSSSFKNRSIVKQMVVDIESPCLDAKKCVSLSDTLSDNQKWIKKNC